jgi:ubiquinone/menaquinone biosynthesis C-methylase UbiE
MYGYVNNQPDDDAIHVKEDKLREWFTRHCDPIQKIIDGLDIGWGGVQRWATSWMPAIEGPHLDLACGYATFLAQLGWRFPESRLIGLNIDFSGPHALASSLLNQAGVKATLVQADARQVPFSDGIFASASCFLGLQDLQIGFGDDGVRRTVAETIRVLQFDGALTLLDTFSIDQFQDLLDDLPILVEDHGERHLNIRWDRHVAERAIELYADGWVKQIRVTEQTTQGRTWDDIHHQMAEEMEHQLATQGYYTPFGPVRMVVARKMKP